MASQGWFGLQFLPPARLNQSSVEMAALRLTERRYAGSTRVTWEVIYQRGDHAAAEGRSPKGQLRLPQSACQGRVQSGKSSACPLAGG